MKKTLALDYGDKRIGVALSYGTLAEPLLVMENIPGIFEAIQEIITQEEVEQVVVGISENVMAEKTEEFIKQLEKTVKIPLHRMDETLSSRTVHAKQKEAGVKLKIRQGPIDHYAAAEFLQEWLDEQG